LSKQETVKDGERRLAERGDDGGDEAGEKDGEMLPCCEAEESFPPNALKEVILLIGGSEVIVLLVLFICCRGFRRGGHDEREGVRNAALPTCKVVE
jgi:hypothetical protein